MRRASTDISPAKEFEVNDTHLELRVKRNDTIRMSKSFDLTYEPDLLIVNNEKSIENQSLVASTRNSMRKPLAH